MKKIIRLSIISAVVTSLFIVSPALAGSLNLEGYGAWRDKNGSQGEFLTHTNVPWKKCRSICLNSVNCTGVEFTLRASGMTTCEVHTGKLHRIKKGNSRDAGTVWVRK